MSVELVDSLIYMPMPPLLVLSLNEAEDGNVLEQQLAVFKPSLTHCDNIKGVMVDS